jgi:hypothetical protein
MSDKSSEAVRMLASDLRALIGPYLPYLVLAGVGVFLAVHYRARIVDTIKSVWPKSAPSPPPIPVEPPPVDPYAKHRLAFDYLLKASALVSEIEGCAKFEPVLRKVAGGIVYPSQVKITVGSGT